MVQKVNINLVSRNMLEGMPQSEKIQFILDEVQGGKVLVLERGLTPTEEAKLIEATMSKIDPETFIGIEMQSYGVDKQGRFARLLGNTKQRPRMAVIGPANLLKTIHKDSQQIQAMIFAPGEGVVTPGA
jgi:uncharacterized protein